MCLSQTKLLGAVIDPAINYDDVTSYTGGDAGGRMLPRRPASGAPAGYGGPYSQSAMEAARRRTQELYNARRSQQQQPQQPLGSPASTARQSIWSRTSGRPQTGSYVIGGVQDDGGDPAFYRPTVAGPGSVTGAGATSGMYFQPPGPEQGSPSISSHSRTMVFEAPMDSPPSNGPDTPGGE